MKQIRSKWFQQSKIECTKKLTIRRYCENAEHHYKDDPNPFFRDLICYVQNPHQSESD